MKTINVIFLLCASMFASATATSYGIKRVMIDNPHISKDTILFLVDGALSLEFFITLLILFAWLFIYIIVHTRTSRRRPTEKGKDNSLQKEETGGAS